MGPLSGEWGSDTRPARCAPFHLTPMLQKVLRNADGRVDQGVVGHAVRLEVFHVALPHLVEKAILVIFSAAHSGVIELRAGKC